MFTLRGQVHFEPNAPVIQDAKVCIQLQDVSQADALSQIVGEIIIDHFDKKQPGDIPFNFEIQISKPLDANRRYAMFIHIDTTRKGMLSVGDYITMESYSVESSKIPEIMQIKVKRIA